MRPETILYFSIFMTSYLLTDLIIMPSLSSNKRAGRWVIFLGGVFMAGATYLLIGAWSVYIIPLIVLLVFIILKILESRFRKESLRKAVLILLIWLVLIIAAAIYLPMRLVITSNWVENFGLVYLSVVTVFAGFLFTVFEGSKLIGLMLAPFQNEIRRSNQNKNDPTGLKSGGKWIGALERSLVFIFIVAGQYAAIGFLVAAKSILRFGEVKESENRMQAEYIIIGTLASILFALVCGLATSWLLGQVN